MLINGGAYSSLSLKTNYLGKLKSKSDVRGAGSGLRTVGLVRLVREPIAMLKP